MKNRQNILVSGGTGSGKTTITKLLQGLYPVQMGLVKIDGIDIREIDKAHLRSSIGVVLQENYFFSGTVRENIALPKQNATLEEIIYVSKLAGADDFVQKLPKGYDTMLEENASNLSGGQRQRVAIAMCLILDPSVIIADEPLSSLDASSGAKILKLLARINCTRKTSILMVSHNMKVIEAVATHVVVMEQGKIIKYGKPAECLDAYLNGSYNS